MIEVRKTAEFLGWFDALADGRARARISARLLRVEAGNMGDVKPVGEGIIELRIDYGPGYRIYCVQRGKVLIVLLCGGDKSSQKADIGRAKRLAKTVD